MQIQLTMNQKHPLLHSGGHTEITGLPWGFQCSLHNSKNSSFQRVTTFA